MKRLIRFRLDMEDDRGDRRPVHFNRTRLKEFYSGRDRMIGWIGTILVFGGSGLAILGVGSLLVLTVFLGSPQPASSIAAFAAVITLPGFLIGMPVGYAFILFNSRTSRVRARERNGRLAGGLCACCYYDLASISPDPDGCATCPECGAAWCLPETTSAARD